MLLSPLVKNSCALHKFAVKKKKKVATLFFKLVYSRVEIAFYGNESLLRYFAGMNKCVVNEAFNM